MKSFHRRPQFVGLSLGAFLVLSVVSGYIIATTRAAASVTVSINGAIKHQIMNGLGVNANVHQWNGGELKPAIDAISGEMGAHTFRVIIDKQDWEATNDNADPATPNWSYYNQIYSQGKMADLFSTIAYLNTKPGTEVMVNLMGDVPAWMGGSKINSTAEDEWVEQVATMVYYGRVTKGLKFNLLGPMNEEDWDGNEGPQVGATQYVRLLDKLGKRLDAMGLSDIRFVGPDTADINKAASPYIPAMAADPYVLGKTAHYASHSYSGDSGSLPGAAAAGGRDFWIDEFSSWCSGCDTGAPNPGDWSFALTTAQYLMNHIQSGASGAQVYDGWDGYYEHHGSFGYWGVEAYDATAHTYSPRKTFFSLGQFFKFIPVGAQRVDTATNNSGLDVESFVESATGRVSMVGINSTGSSQTVVFGLSSLPAVSSFTLYESSSTQNMAKIGSYAVAGSQLSVIIPNNTVFSLDSAGAASPPAPTAAAATPTPSPTSSPTPSAGPLVGDINLDQHVNVFDLSGLLVKWNTADASADLNHDGKVNIFDLSALLSHWTG